MNGQSSSGHHFGISEGAAAAGPLLRAIAASIIPKLAPLIGYEKAQKTFGLRAGGIGEFLTQGRRELSNGHAFEDVLRNEYLDL